MMNEQSVADEMEKDTNGPIVGVSGTLSLSAVAID